MPRRPLLLAVCLGVVAAAVAIASLATTRDWSTVTALRWSYLAVAFIAVSGVGYWILQEPIDPSALCRMCGADLHAMPRVPFCAACGAADPRAPAQS